MPYIKEMSHMLDRSGTILYLKAGDDVYFQNPNDSRPSAQYYAWSVPDDNSHEKDLRDFCHNLRG
jgi:hypothetical protein